MSGARLAVLVSGSGSNLQAMIDASRAKKMSGHIAVVISNRPGVRALDRASAADIESLVIDHKAYASRDLFDAALDDALTLRSVDFVILAGFMRLLTPAFVSKWRGRLINIHPSLLPAFPGAHSIHDAFAAQAKRTGVTVHFVDSGTDTGPVIAQEGFDLAENETEESLEGRIHAVEHQLYPRVVDELARGRVRLEDNRAVWQA